MLININGKNIHIDLPISIGTQKDWLKITITNMLFADAYSDLPSGFTNVLTMLSSFANTVGHAICTDTINHLTTFIIPSELVKGEIIGQLLQINGVIVTTLISEEEIMLRAIVENLEGFGGKFGIVIPLSDLDNDTPEGLPNRMTITYDENGNAIEETVKTNREYFSHRENETNALLFYSNQHKKGVIPISTPFSEFLVLVNNFGLDNIHWRESLRLVKKDYIEEIDV